MTDRFVYSCRRCGVAIVDGWRPVTLVECPGCGTNRDAYNDDHVHVLFKQEGQLR